MLQKHRNSLTTSALFVFCGVIFILGFHVGGLQLALLLAVRELNLYGAIVGLPVTVQFIALSITPLIFGPVSDRFGKKKIIAVFMVIFVLGSITTYFSGGILLFLVGIFIIGAGYSVCECSITAAIADLVGEDSEKSEKYINFSQSFFCAGAAVSPLILHMLMSNFYMPWRISFLICAIAMAVLIPTFLALYPSAIVEAQSVKEVDGSKKQVRKPLVLIGFIICMFIYSGVESGVAYFADMVLSIQLNSPHLGAYAIFLFWTAMGLGRFFFGRKKTIPPYATAASLLLTAMVLVAIALNQSEIVMLALFAVVGFTCACVWPGIVNLAVSTNKSATGTIMSYMNLGGGLGGAVFPFAMGVIMDVAGVPIAFFGLAVLAALASAMIYKFIQI